MRIKPLYGEPVWGVVWNVHHRELYVAPLPLLGVIIDFWPRFRPGGLHTLSSRPEDAGRQVAASFVCCRCGDREFTHGPDKRCPSPDPVAPPDTRF